MPKRPDKVQTQLHNNLPPNTQLTMGPTPGIGPEYHMGPFKIRDVRYQASEAHIVALDTLQLISQYINFMGAPEDSACLALYASVLREHRM